MTDARTLADAIIHRLEMPAIPPSYSSTDGLPANEAALEEADDAVLEAFAVTSGRVSLGDLIQELRRHVGEVKCGQVSRREAHPPHRWKFQAEDDSPEVVEADCPGWDATEIYCEDCGHRLHRYRDLRFCDDCEKRRAS